MTEQQVKLKIANLEQQESQRRTRASTLNSVLSLAGSLASPVLGSLVSGLLKLEDTKAQNASREQIADEQRKVDTFATVTGAKTSLVKTAVGKGGLLGLIPTALSIGKNLLDIGKRARGNHDPVSYPLITPMHRFEPTRPVAPLAPFGRGPDGKFLDPPGIKFAPPPSRISLPHALGTSAGLLLPLLVTSGFEPDQQRRVQEERRKRDEQLRQQQERQREIREWHTRRQERAEAASQTWKALWRQGRGQQPQITEARVYRDPGLPLEQPHSEQLRLVGPYQRGDFYISPGMARQGERYTVSDGYIPGGRTKR